MPSLDLNDVRWNNLAHREYTPGRSKKSPIDIAKELRTISSNPSAETERFKNLWPYMCSEGTAYSSAFAAIPHVVDFGSRTKGNARIYYLAFVDTVLSCNTMPLPEFEKEFNESVKISYGLAIEALAERPSEIDLRYMLALICRIYDFDRLAEVLIYKECPECAFQIE